MADCEAHEFEIGRNFADAAFFIIIGDELLEIPSECEFAVLVLKNRTREKTDELCD